MSSIIIWPHFIQFPKNRSVFAGSQQSVAAPLFETRDAGYNRIFELIFFEDLGHFKLVIFLQTQMYVF
jgi:hypothetical protein